MEHMILPPPTEPMKVARKLSTKFFTKDGVLVLRYWRGWWWEWRRSHWIDRHPRDVKAQAYKMTEHALCTDTTDIPSPEEREKKKKKPDKKSQALWEELEKELGEQFQRIVDEVVADNPELDSDDPDAILGEIIANVPIAWWEPTKTRSPTCWKPWGRSATWTRQRTSRSGSTRPMTTG